MTTKNNENLTVSGEDKWREEFLIELIRIKNLKATVEEMDEILKGGSAWGLEYEFYLAACKKRQEDIEFWKNEYVSHSEALLRSNEQISQLKKQLGDLKSNYNFAYNDDLEMLSIEQLRERIVLMHSWVRHHQGSIERECVKREHLKSLINSAIPHMEKYKSSFESRHFSGELEEWVKEARKSL